MSTPLVEHIIATMPPGDLLRSVAARMRELAGAASPGTWDHMCKGSEGCSVLNDGRLRDRRTIAFFGRKAWQADHADADYLTAMQPAVVRATARLLEDLADHHPGSRSLTVAVMDGLEICRAFMDSSGWRPTLEMTEAQG